MIGKSLAHYEIVEKIGAGGMGEVYRARDTRLDRDVALKVLPAEMAESSERRARFEREAKAVAALKHPNIVTIHSVEEAEGVLFLTMELVEGRMLAERIPQGGVALDQLFGWAIPLADAMATAHGKGIAHRDLKPANLMLDEAGRLKVLDFGLAKLIEAGPGEGATVELGGEVTGEGRILGTASYMSPEQAEGKEVDARSDIFSMGILLYELATGKRPFQGDTDISTISAILKDTPQPITELNAQLPRHLGRIVQRCLAKEPERRYQTALDLRNELEQLHDELKSETSLSSSGSSLGTRSEDPAPAGATSPGDLATTGTSATHLGHAGTDSRRWWLALPIVAVIAAVAWGLLSRGDVPAGRTAGETGLDFNTLAVLYFENLSDPTDSDRLGRIAASLLTPALSNASDLNLISEQRLFDLLRRLGHPDAAAIDRSVASQVAREAGAGRAILGQVSLLGSRLELRSQVVDMESGTVLFSHRAEGQGQESLFSLIDELAASIMEDMDAAPARSEPATSVVNLTTNSVDAYRLYQEGIHEFRNHRFVEARELFEQALQEDPTFAMAHFYDAFPYWPGVDADQTASITRARHFSDGATRAEQGLIEGAYQWIVEEDLEAAVATLTRTEAEFPQENRLAFLRGRIHYFDQNYEAALEALEASRRSNPDHTYTLNSQGYTYSGMRRHEEAIETIQHYVSLEPENANARDSLAEMYLRAGQLEMAAATYEKVLEIEPEFFSAFYLAYVEAMMGKFGRSTDRLLGMKIQDPGFSSFETFTRALYSSLLLSLSGRFEEADRAVAEGIEAGVVMGDPGLVSFMCWFGAALTLQTGNARDVDCPDATAGENRFWIGPRAVYDALIALREARLDEADRVARALKPGPDDFRLEPEYDRVLQQLEEKLLAMVLVARGRLEEAREKLQAVRPLSVPAWGPNGVASSGVMNLLLDGDSLARALVAEGRPREALAEYEALMNPDRADSEFWLVPPIYHYRVGQIYEELGEASEAVSHYRVFLTAWRDADAGLTEPGDARRRIEALSP